MVLQKYKIRYLPLFYEDLKSAIYYIGNKLNNKQAANELIEEIQIAIEERLLFPEAYEKFNSIKKRKYPYYRIYVKNYIIFYVVLPDNINANIKIMEVRRLIYNKRRIDNIL